ncbi:hypothetical protein TL16_g01122 [Triparma laevis f. inornata]|uniref:BZIP domain-containing protein n=1 Tax=Triparma laevis f. inornata TaxID=1714386 RepID=A0A9W7DQX9_9STRA|nr:hypothetical protein TL16_g01122 [Triparma laevis f. inornata]
MAPSVKRGPVTQAERDDLSGVDGGVDDDNLEVQQLLRETRASTPEVFVPGTGAKIDEEESDDEGGGKRARRNASMSQEMRRERNKMHAKATRERKKAYLDAMEKAIAIVNDENSRLSTMLGNAQAPSIMTIMTSMKADKSLVQEMEIEDEEGESSGSEGVAPQKKFSQSRCVGSSAVSEDGSGEVSSSSSEDHNDQDSTSGEQGSVAQNPANPTDLNSPGMHGMITPSVSGSGGSGNESLSDDESEDM